VVLGAAEVRELERSWREAFDESLEPGFTFRGHNGWEAHLQFLIFHDCPADLAERWAAAPEAA